MQRRLLSTHLKDDKMLDYTSYLRNIAFIIEAMLSIFYVDFWSEWFNTNLNNKVFLLTLGSGLFLFFPVALPCIFMGVLIDDESEINVLGFGWIDLLKYQATIWFILPFTKSYWDQKNDLSFPRLKTVVCYAILWTFGLVLFFPMYVAFHFVLKYKAKQSIIKALRQK